METRGTGPRRYRRRGQGFGDRTGRGSGLGGGRGGIATDEKSLATRTAIRALVAAGAYVAQDVRDPEGLTRPMLRRAAMRMAVSRQPALRRLGAAYLRGDPPVPGEFASRMQPALPAAAVPAIPGIREEPAAVIDVTTSAGERAD
jgi:hypothetical protein